jgi:ABC-type antimicrobial peptide transport system permease subunit
MAVLASGLGLTALGLACTGLYGLLAYAVSRQSKDIGLRLALGADRRTVVWMVLRDSLLLTAVGIALGLGTALALGRYARNLLYQITTTDPASILSAVVILVSLAFCAGLIPARRAARVDPVVSLRCE